MELNNNTALLDTLPERVQNPLVAILEPIGELTIL